MIVVRNSIKTSINCNHHIHLLSNQSIPSHPHHNSPFPPSPPAPPPNPNAAFTIPSAGPSTKIVSPPTDKQAVTSRVSDLAADTCSRPSRLWARRCSARVLGLSPLPLGRVGRSPTRLICLGELLVEVLGRGWRWEGFTAGAAGGFLAHVW